MKICTQCRFVVQDSENYCPRCGSSSLADYNPQNQQRQRPMNNQQNQSTMNGQSQRPQRPQRPVNNSQTQSTMNGQYQRPMNSQYQRPVNNHAQGNSNDFFEDVGYNEVNPPRNRPVRPQRPSEFEDDFDSGMNRNPVNSYRHEDDGLEFEGSGAAGVGRTVNPSISNVYDGREYPLTIKELFINTLLMMIPFYNIFRFFQIIIGGPRIKRSLTNMYRFGLIMYLVSIVLFGILIFSMYSFAG